MRRAISKSEVGDGRVQPVSVTICRSVTDRGGPSESSLVQTINQLRLPDEWALALLKIEEAGSAWLPASRRAHGK